MKNKRTNKANGRLSTTGVIIVGTGLGIVGIATLLIVDTWITPLLPDQRAFEMIFQFLLVTILGGAIAFIYREHDKRREEHRENSRAHREMYAELVGVYNETKAARRILKASVSRRMIAKSDYEEQIKRINAAQLAFEGYQKRARRGQLGFDDEIEAQLAQLLSTADRYLNDCIIEEYERNLCEFSGEPPVLSMDNLQGLDKFLNDRKVYNEGLHEPFDKALELIAAFEFGRTQSSKVGTKLTNETNARPANAPKIGA